MALTSPGVEVTIIDQSQYLPAAPGSVPLVVLATAQDKVNPTGTGIAEGTKLANAGKLFLATSQRDLVTYYGMPKFYQTSDGTPILGDELNEYGLLAAYSALSTSNLCYTLRADIDLASLAPSTGRPTGAPANGTYWLDTTSSAWGIYEWDAVKEVFVLQSPLVITDEGNLSNGQPLQSLGSIGSYAVVALENYDNPSPTNSPYNATYWYKTSNNIWQPLANPVMLESNPCVVAENTGWQLTGGDEFTITLNGASGVETCVLTVMVNANDTATDIASTINSKNWLGVQAAVVDGYLSIYTSQPYGDDGITFANTSGTPLDTIGIMDNGTYYSPTVFYGTAAQAPLWGAGQTKPRPSGSVWIKLGSAGVGLVPSIKKYNSTSGSWVSKSVGIYNSDTSAINSLDATGGQAIPAGTLYCQYNIFNANQQYASSPLYFWERYATGETVATGTTTVFPPSGTGSLPDSIISVTVSIPNNGSSTKPVTISAGSSATDFVTAWQAANIPYTTAAVTTDGAIQLTHTKGGVIVMRSSDAATGLPNDCLMLAGFEAGVTEFVKIAQAYTVVYENLTGTNVLSSGSGATFTVANLGTRYIVTSVSGGINYQEDDIIAIDGSLLGGQSGQNDLVLVVTAVSGGAITNVTAAVDTMFPQAEYAIEISNWVPFTYTANEGAPTELPADYTNWFYSATNQVDIMVNTSTGWKGYKSTGVYFNSNGFPVPTGSNNTDPNGPIISATEPTTQSDGVTALGYGQLWIDTSAEALVNYPMIYRWQQVSGQDTWVLIDNTDQTSGTGVVFADARWSSDQDLINPANDPIPTIVSLLTSNNLDLDAPESSLYPVGMLLFNTRRSGNNVKQWRNNYFTPANFPDQTYPTITSTWVSASGHRLDGSAYMGSSAQRNMIVQSIIQVLETNTDIRDENNFFNLLATPNYWETQTALVGVNDARGETGYIVGDTPMTLPDDATAVAAWANLAAPEGPTRNTYLGLFYPSGLANTPDGQTVAVPPSHMMISTFLRNDQIAYPWFAAAGTRRGLINNALQLGYINSATGEWQYTNTRVGIRDVLYYNFINPLVSFTGTGLLNYGNKTSFNSTSALDRTNVARLIAYIRRQLVIATRPFVFEPNTAVTRQQVQGVVQSLMLDLVAKSGIYDYLVVCDDSNNTPARIDRNELWVDVAIEPVKAIEFIYIPVRVLNTGEIKGLV